VPEDLVNIILASLSGSLKTSSVVVSVNDSSFLSSRRGFKSLQDLGAKFIG
jgi:hypothetical protein